MGDLVSLQGWVDQFVPEGFTLRARGQCLLVVTGDNRVAESLTRETVVSISGRVLGPQQVELVELQVINRCTRLPFEPRNATDVSAALRSRYRYLALRDESMRVRIERMHHFRHSVSEELHRRGFVSVDTPVLSRRSGSGATEFAAHGKNGKTWALPQSPQVYGQLIVIGGIERYYQWAHCFRDEDLRSNRQPEFTQLHVEGAFMDLSQMMQLVDEVTASAAAAIGAPISAEPARLSYRSAMRQFGTDKPDLRYAPSLELIPPRCDHDGRLQNLFLALPPPGLTFDASATRELRVNAQRSGFELLGFIKPDGWRRKRFPMVMHTHEAMSLFRVGHKTAAKEGLLFVGDAVQRDALQLAIYRWGIASGQLPLPRRLALWVEHFPIFERGPSGAVAPACHPFAMPADKARFDSARSADELLALDALAADLVINGEEIGSGSSLIYDYAMQVRMLQLMGIAKAGARSRFGFLLDALQAGAPPMTGFGLGAERCVAQLLDLPKIQSVMAFPKTKEGNCPVTGA